VTFTATVTGPVGGFGTPTGTVDFQDNGADISTCAAQSVSSTGTAACTVSYSSVASHAVTAVYGGDGSYATSTSQPVNLSLNQTPVTITANNVTVTFGQTPVFTFTTTGLQGSDALTTQPTCTVTGPHTNVGSYPITCSGAS